MGQDLCDRNAAHGVRNQLTVAIARPEEVPAMKTEISELRKRLPDEHDARAKAHETAAVASAERCCNAYDGRCQRQ